MLCRHSEKILEGTSVYMKEIRRIKGGNDHMLYRKMFANHEGVQTRKVQGYIGNAGIEVWSWLQLV